MEPGVAAAQSANVQPASKAGGKNKLPFIIGGTAAGVIALVLIAVFVAILRSTRTLSWAARWAIRLSLAPL